MLRYHYQEFGNNDRIASAGILMRKQQIALIALGLWLTLVSGVMILMHQVDLEIFFVLSLIGILVIMQLLEQKFAQPSYLRYIRYLIAAGIVIFGVIVVHKVMEILA
jgi:hypothetical protein